MKLSTLSWIALLLVGLLGGCRRHHVEPVYDMPVGGTYYTQFSLHYEKDVFRTTNYRRGVLLPINSEVTLLSMNAREAVVQVKATGRRLVVENMDKHTYEAIDQAFAKIFGEAPVDLSRFTDEQRAAILAGRALPGMTREAALAALGHPPASGTPILDASPWKYWDTRWTTFLVHFDAEGKVVSTGR